MAEQQYQERGVAVKLKIKEIKEGDYIIEEGWKPNYLLTKEGKKVSRVNLVGVLLDKEINKEVMNLVLDDGSGKIVVRSFEESKKWGEREMGEGLLVIGKIRIYNGEKYIAPEIIKKVDLRWLKLRKREWGRGREREKIAEEEKEEGQGEEDFSGGVDKKIKEAIKVLDKGEGALIEEVKEKVGREGTEEVIGKMLKEGGIFQNLPGRVKVL